VSGRSTIYTFIGKDEFSKVADDVAKAAHGMGKKFGAAGLAVAGAAGAVAAGVGVASAALVIMGKNAAEDEAAQRKLAIALRNSAGATRGQVAEVERWISAQGEALGITDDKMRPALQRLTQATGDVGKAQSLMGVAMDASVGSGKSLEVVSAALAKAQNGNMGALSKLGVQIKDTDGKTMSFKDTVLQMSETFKGQAAGAADSLDGKMGRLQLMFDEAKESIGSRLLPVAERLADWFINSAKPAIENMVTAVWPKLQGLFGYIQHSAEVILPKLQEYWGKLRAAFDESRPGLQNIADMFALVGRAIVEKVIPALADIAGKVVPVVIKAIGKLGEILPPIVGAYLDGVATIVGGFRFLFMGVTKHMEAILWTAEKTMGWIPNIGEKIKAARSGFTQFRNWAVDSLGDVQASLRDTADAARAVGEHFIDAYRQIPKEALSSPVKKAEKDITTSVGNIEDVLTNIPKAVKKTAEKVKKSGPDLKGAFDQVLGQVRDALDAARSRIEAFNESAASLGKSIARGLGAFGEDVADFATKMANAISPDQLLANMQASVIAVDEWRASLANVASLGLPQNIVEELRAMGLDSADELRALNLMSAEQLQQFGALWQARDQSGAVEGAKQYADDIATELAGLPATLKAVGAQAMAGLAEGLGSQKGIVGDQALDAIAEIINRINDEEDLLTIQFEYEFVPKGAKQKGKKKKKSSKGGGSGGGGYSEGYGSSVGHGLMAATAGAGSLGAGFGKWGPYWSWNRRNGMGQHDGADVSVGAGTPVYATRAGRIVDTGSSGWAGNHVEWESNGTRFIYAHLSNIAKWSGSVGSGTMLGRAGSTGNATGPHLHVQASRSGSYVNPAYYLADGGIVRRRRGGTLAVIGEGRYDEAVVPLKPGVRTGGGDTYNVTIAGGLDSAETIARRVQTALLDLKRRQGVSLGLS
jgi:murein DD-endopeptidase MepM/ murein hydrolase activator NlpD